LLEVADIFRRHGAAYRQKFAKPLLPRHLRAMAAIELSHGGARRAGLSL
jgi:hypothetical protein